MSRLQIWAVVSRTVTTPPTEADDPPVLYGDGYLVPDAAVGEWAGHGGQIAIFSARGWAYIPPAVGRIIYVEAENKNYQFTVAGVWAATLNPQVNSVPLGVTIGWGKYVIVENMSTNAPPPSPLVGQAYVIGASPTGAWAGQSNKIAICEAAGTFTIYTPGAGWRVYNKATAVDYQFSGTVWISASGDFDIEFDDYKTAGSHVWTKRAGLMAAEISVLGGGGGTDTSGGSSVFHTLISATGGSTVDGGIGAFGSVITQGAPPGGGGFPGGGFGGVYGRGNTGGGFSMDYYLAAALPSSASVAVGAGGTGATAGNVGRVLVRNFIRI